MGKSGSKTTPGAPHPGLKVAVYYVGGKVPYATEPELPWWPIGVMVAIAGMAMIAVLALGVRWRTEFDAWRACRTSSALALS